MTPSLCRFSVLKAGNLKLHSPSVCVKEESGSQHPYRGCANTSSHPGLAASLHNDARKLCREQCFSGKIKRSQSSSSLFCCLNTAAKTSRTSKTIRGSLSRVIHFNDKKKNRKLVMWSYLQPNHQNNLCWY